MASARRSPAKMALRALVTLAVAAVLVGATTLLRAALNPYLGALSPFMMYVGAVLAAGLIRGTACGLLVMLAGGVLGFRLFLNPGGVAQPGSMVALMVFWGVAAPVLVTANELRVQLRTTMERLTEALQRNGRGGY